MQFPTGGIAREPFQVDWVQFPSRRYSPDERSNAFALIRPRFCRGRFCTEEGGKANFMKKQNTLRGLAVSGIMGALGFVLMFFEISLPFIIPEFIKLDFSEIPAIITAYAFGPQYGILVCLIKNLLHLPITTSVGVGELSNFVLGAVFAGIAGLIYKIKKTRKNALLGAVIGALAMGLICIATNYFIVYPMYAKLFLPMDAIIGMYKVILPSADTLFKALVIFNFPFTFLKGMADAAVCFAVYKRLSPILKKT